MAHTELRRSVLSLVLFATVVFAATGYGHIWRAFDKTVRRKPLAGAADAAYGFSIDFRLEIVARSGVPQKRCY
jgi:hypothetical protein